MLRANVSSVLPPKFRENFSALCRYGHLWHRYRFPVTWDHVGVYLTHMVSLPSLPFSPLLEGYFHNSVTEICTGHLLSSHQKTVYSSSSLHLFYGVKLKFKFIIVCIINIVNHVFLMFFNYNVTNKWNIYRFSMSKHIVWASRANMPFISFLLFYAFLPDIFTDTAFTTRQRTITTNISGSVLPTGISIVINHR